MTLSPDRQHIIALIDQASAAGAREQKACELIGLSRRTIHRWRKAGFTGKDGRPGAVRPRPANALSPEERKAIITTCNLPENASKPPAQIVPELADKGIYIASESSFYRVLHAEHMQTHRGRARAPAARKAPEPHTAKAPGEVWVWDITWLPTVVQGLFYKLYMIMDLFSRKLIAAEVWEEENSEHSITIVSRTVLSENVAAGKTPLLHGDNGSPVKSATLQAKLYDLGITPSYSRPRVSNDNSHAEAVFRTMKYHPSLSPVGFSSLEEAREWSEAFVQWYNTEHLHSSLNYVTPEMKHQGEDHAVLASRAVVYDVARSNHPERWIKGRTRNWNPVSSTTLNPRSPRELEAQLKKAS